MTPNEEFPEGFVTDVVPLANNVIRTDEEFSDWPQFIREQIRGCKTPRSFKRLISHFRQRRPIDDRLLSEYPSYAVIIIGTVLAIVSLWVRTGTPPCS